MSSGQTRQEGPIGLVVAMEAELVHTLRTHPPHKTSRSGPWTFHHMRIGDHEVVAVRCGMGLINAAAGTEALIAALGPRMIINYGCSGAHRREIMPGDVVIGERVVHHSAMQVLPDGSERYSGFGYDVAGERMDAAELTCDPTLVAAATAAAAGPVERWPAELFWPRETPRRDPVVHRGTVASADIWTQAIPRLDLLHARHGSLCEDMEAAAVAQICALHQIPFLTIKDISNNEYLQASDIEGFTDFPVAEIGKRAAALAGTVIAGLN
jgi:adenosylhomocysteine nucleosidase